VRVLLTYGPIGYSGEVVTLDAPDAPFLKDLPYQVTALGPQRTTYGYTPKLGRWLRQNRHRFDGVVVNGLWQYCGLAARLNLHGRVPYVVFTHGMLDPYFKKTFPLKHFKKAIYWYLVEYWVLKGAFRVLFTASQEEKLARRSFTTYSWTPYVVPYGSGGTPYSAEEAVPAFQAAMPHLNGKRFLLFLGRIHRKKGVDLLVNAFAQCAVNDPGLELVVAGPDQQGWAENLMRSARKSGVDHRIHWPGILLGREKWGSLYACEAFILPSHQENFGIAVAEALACGRPVLLSDQVNIAPEVVEDGAGYMESDTLAGTVRLIDRWIATSPEQRETMRILAARSFHTRYDMKENAKTIIGLFSMAGKV